MLRLPVITQGIHEVIVGDGLPLAVRVAIARACVAAAEAERVKGRGILSPYGLAARISDARCRAFRLGADAWAEQLARDTAQQAGLADFRRDNLPPAAVILEVLLAGAVTDGWELHDARLEDVSPLVGKALRYLIGHNIGAHEPAACAPCDLAERGRWRSLLRRQGLAEVLIQDAYAGLVEEEQIPALSPRHAGARGRAIAPDDPGYF